MATVTGYTAEKMDEIVDNTVESATVNGVGHLILNKHGGTTVDAGSVIGPAGPPGTDVVALRGIGELAIGLWELEAKVLAQDNNMIDWLGEPFVPGINHVSSRTLDGAGYPILNIFRDPDRDQGFIGIDDLQPFARFKSLPLDSLTNGITGIHGAALSPDKKWLVVVNSGAIRVYPVSADGTIITNSVAPAVTTIAGGNSAVNSGFSLSITPDGKAIIVLLNASPYIVAYAFNTTTGVIGAAAAAPGVLMAGASNYRMSINANSGYVAIAGGESASPYFTVYAYNSTTNTWGAKSAAPASPPSSTTNGIAFDDAGTTLIVSTNTPLLRAYAFNNATGAIGAASDAGGTLTGLSGFRQKAGKVICSTGSTSPFIRGYNITAGVWSAQWANPASLPSMDIGSGGAAVVRINDDASAITYYDGAAPSYLQAMILNATSFGAKITPTNFPTGFLPPSPGWIIPWPFEVQSDFLLFNNSVNRAFDLSILGDLFGTASLTGQMVTITKTLVASCQQIYIIDSFSKSSANVSRQYDISLDGGTTWNNNVPVGTIALMAAPGTQLKIRITMTRTALGQTGQIFWFNVWAG